MLPRWTAFSSPAATSSAAQAQSLFLEIGLAQRPKRPFHVLHAPQEEQRHLQLRRIVDFSQQFLKERVGELGE